MSTDSKTLSARARSAAQSGNWPVVRRCAEEILRHNAAEAEGHFLTGLAAKATRRAADAIKAFEKTMSLDPARYDAAVELAGLFLGLQRQTEAYRLLESYRDRLHNSPRYLDMAGTTYSNLGTPEKAWELFERANELQPGIHRFQANLAGCCVHVGRIGQAKKLYRKLLEHHPSHQRHHYQLSGLDKARDDTHIREMKEILAGKNLPPDKNIFLYYAIGKELEDLGHWDEAFGFYKKAGDAIATIARYDVARDEALIGKIVDVCSADWLMSGSPGESPHLPDKTAVFIIGLPRTGTTLVERILSSHSQVESAGETHFLELAIARESGVPNPQGINDAVIEAAGNIDSGRIASAYLADVAYLLADNPLFIEKLPENILYAGFIAREFPDAKLVHVTRHPMDACLALYKQSYFRYAYTLDDLARYYIAHDRLVRHWQAVLGKRLVEISYEDLVQQQENETRSLLKRLGLDFEPACLAFETNPKATATASSVQVRQKMHTGSVGKWRCFEKHLQPLQQALEAAGIDTT